MMEEGQEARNVQVYTCICRGGAGGFSGCKWGVVIDRVVHNFRFFLLLLSMAGLHFLTLLELKHGLGLPSPVRY